MDVYNYDDMIKRATCDITDSTVKRNIPLVRIIHSSMQTTTTLLY